MFDLIVLGGGPGGYLAAERAAQGSLKVLLIEKRNIGGVCLNEGCVPSKTFLHSSKIYEYATHGDKYGVSAQNVTYDQKTVLHRKNKIVKNLVGGIRSTLKHHGVTTVEGEGKILNRTAGVVEIEVNKETYQAKNLIIATGSEAFIPPIPGVKAGIEQNFVLTNREVLDLDTLPKKFIVIGGGVIGLEMATYFNAVGSKVTVIEMLDHIGGPSDQEISSALLEQFQKKGITFHLNAKVTEIKGNQVIFATQDGSSHAISGDKVLLSVGRKPVIHGFGLESINIFTQKGHIVCDETGLTNVPNVYAIGDVTGTYMLAHAAYREAEVAVNTILGQKDTMRYAAMPSVIYTNPEMAFVGETEETCMAKGLPYQKVVLPLNYSGRYMAENEGGQGFIKILINTKTQTLLGCHLLGGYASEIILAAGMMIESEMRIKDIKEYIFPHPTVCEIIREAIFQIKL